MTSLSTTDILSKDLEVMLTKEIERETILKNPFTIVDMTGTVKESTRFPTWEAASKWVQHLTQWNPNSRFIIEEGEKPGGACCTNEDRNMNGGCNNCGDPCL